MMGIVRNLPRQGNVLPTLDDLAADPQRARELDPETVAMLHSRCLVALNALWGRSLETRPAPVVIESTPEQDRLLAIEEAAAMIQKSQDWLYRNARQLPFTVRVGRHLRFSSSGIQRFIRERSGLA